MDNLGERVFTSSRFPQICPCCHRGVIEESHDICSVCGWEYDDVQNREPDFAGGANRLCLNDYRKAYLDRNEICRVNESDEAIRTIEVSEITEAVRSMCIEANLNLSRDMCSALIQAEQTETNSLGKNILGQLEQNLKIASKEHIPICQDTGMAVIFMNIGQNVHFVGGELEAAVNKGVRLGYEEGYLRKSVVVDPLNRVNTGNNTPAVLHCSIVPGKEVEITVAPKGFGSENMSRVFMLKPADGEEGVKNSIITAVREAGANACPPMVVGVGVGGDFEKAAIMAKHALTLNLNTVNVYSESENITEWQIIHDEVFSELNSLNIGPGGMGGINTVLGVNIETYPTHIAGLPLAVNICCHVNRHVTRVI